MKNFTRVFLAAGLFMAAAGFVMTGCTKEGPAGANGTNGKDGIDANATCQQCHNFSDTIVAKIFQYDASQHATGSTVFEASRNSCAPCHCSQGFLEVVSTGAFNTVGPIAEAAQINCRTCHQIHKTYTNTDWALTTTASFRMRCDSTVTIDLTADGGTANLCGRCHQARAASPALTNPGSTTDSISITSTRWGPHHGTQANILAGQGAYNATSFGNTNHKNYVGCTSCHGQNAQGDLVGGHVLAMYNDETGDNVAVCKTCHSSATSFDYAGRQTEIEGLMQTLKVKLAEFNMLDTNTMLINKKKYAQADLAVYYNFMLVEADRSLGVHNYEYCRAMLQAGIDHFSVKGL